MTPKLRSFVDFAVLRFGGEWATRIVVALSLTPPFRPASGFDREAWLVVHLWVEAIFCGV
jgi:hypothetical protein